MESTQFTPDASIQETSSRMSEPQKGRTIYDASVWEVMAKNFLSGLFNGLGHVAVYIIAMFSIYMIFLQIVWPKIEPILKSYQDTLKSIQNMQETAAKAPQNLQDKLQQLLPFTQENQPPE